MTDTRFSVQLDELGATGLRLAGLERQLARATRRVRDAATAGAGDVAGGLDEFGRHWKHGMDNLHHTVQELHAALTVAHDGYRDHETQLSSHLSGRP